MPQHIAYVICIADSAFARGSLIRWWNEGGEIAINQNASPWLLYYSCWLDPWLSSWAYGVRLKEMGLEMTNPIEDVYKIKPSAKNIGLLKSSLRRKHQYRESRWIDWNLLEASMAYEKVRLKRLVYLFNRVTAGVLGDDELKKAISVQ